MNTWIVYRVVKDKRCTDGQRWVAIGWVCHNNEVQARDEALKIFRLFDQEDLKLVLTTQGYGFSGVSYWLWFAAVVLMFSANRHCCLSRCGARCCALGDSDWDLSC